MRTFFGMVLGCLLTVAVVYVHDSAVTSTVANGQPGTAHMIVNWDVAARKWGDIRHTIHTAWIKLQGANARS